MYERESNGYLVLFVWVIFLVFGTYLFTFGYYVDVKELSQNAQMPEELFGFTGSYFYSFLENLGEAGRALYLKFQLFDYINLVLLAFTLAITIRHFLTKLQVRKIFYLLVGFPVLLMIIDTIENSLIIYLIVKLPSKFFSLAKLASDLTQLKLLLFVVSLLALSISGFILILRKLFSKN